MTVPLDTTVLRKVLRLVHCLQKERGASCAYRAAPQHDGRHVSALTPARKDTDQALAMLGKSSKQTIYTVLNKIRNMVSSEEKRNEGGYHKLLLCYNTLISNIIHEDILRKTNSQRQFQRQASSHVGSGHSDSQDGKTLSEVGGNGGPLLPPTPKSSGAATASGGGMTRSHHGLPRVWSHQNMTGSIKPRRTRQLSEHKALLATVSDNFFHTITEVENNAARVVLKNDGLTFTRGHETDNIIQLFNLLDLFVRLKESAGVERATLSSMLAAGSVESRFLLNDLVLEVENQRRQLDELVRLPVGPLHDLIQELVTLTPKLQQLQEDILNGLQLEQLKETYDSARLWSAMTLYINKLHSFELLLVEEIECCCSTDIQPTENGSHNNHKSAEASVGVLKRAFGDHGAASSSSTALLECIESLPPEEVKKRLLSAMSKTKIIEAAPAMATGDDQQHQQQQEQEPQVVDSSRTGVEELLRELTKAPASKEWEIDLYQVHFLKRIGQGAAGTTYLAKWSGLEVAVKVASISEMGLEGWRHEVQALQKLHHPNIIRLLGSVYHPSPLTFCLVLEYCNAGDLADALERPTGRNFFFHVAANVSKGMTYLHSKQVIHRDIKPGNVLLDGSVTSGIFSVKVTDFGVAIDSNSTEKTAETGTYRWMAEEVIRHEKYTLTADVYSFGIVLWQLVTREVPFCDMSQIEAAAMVIDGLRPPFPAGTPVAVRELIERCWSRNPDLRPSFEEITEELIDVQGTLTNEQDKEWMEAPLGHSVYKQQEPKQKTMSIEELKAHYKQQEPKQKTISNEELKALEKQILLDQMKEPKGEKKRGFKKRLFSRKSSHF